MLAQLNTQIYSEDINKAAIHPEKEKGKDTYKYMFVLVSVLYTIAGVTADEGFGLSFAGPTPAGDAFHKSMPIFKLVAGTTPMGFPDTIDGTTAPVVVLCALADKKSNQHYDIIPRFIHLT